MRIMGIDPASYVTGMSVIDTPQCLLEWDLAKAARPKKKQRVTVQDAIGRVEQIIDQIVAFYERWEPDHIAIEVPSGHTHRSLGNGKVTHMQIYGIAVGMIIQAMKSLRPGEVWCYDEHEWTHGESKVWRADMVSRVFPEYDMSKDKGLDGADAIGVAWYAANIIPLVLRLEEADTLDAQQRAKQACSTKTK